MSLKVVMDPEQRRQHLRTLLDLEGLFDVDEQAGTAYCPISLTSTPVELKPVLEKRQRELMSLLASVGIKAYDPGSSAKYSPDLNLDASHREVYFFDSARVASGEYFTGHKLLPSDGPSVESEIAKQLGKKSVLFLDKAIRVSRMMPSRTIYLAYDNFEVQADRIRQVFEMLKGFDTGMGLVANLPVLVGFPRAGGSPVDLEDTVYKEFPELQFRYNGKVPIVKLKAENPELFYEMLV